MHKFNHEGLMKKITQFLFVITMIAIAGCAQLNQILKQTNIQKPQVEITKIAITGLSFEEADLLFDIKINNPNSIGISMAGFDYDLHLNNTSFLKGDRNKKMEIIANGDATIQLPLSLNYQNIYKTYQNLKDADDINYTLNTGFSFDLPFLGPVRIPVSKSGKFPTLKLPSISLHAIKLNRLTLTGADFNIGIKVDNPNTWSVLLNNLDYTLNINGSQWIKGKTTNQVNIPSKQNNIINIPLSLSFLEIGSSVYSLISNGKGLNYSLTGSAKLGSSLEMLGQFDLPFNKSGYIDILK